MDSKFLDMPQVRRSALAPSHAAGSLDHTNDLLSLCHIEWRRQVLNVGCGLVLDAPTSPNYGTHGWASVFPRNDRLVKQHAGREA